MMHWYCCLVSVLVTLLVPAVQSVKYRSQGGNFIIGAILPLTSGADCKKTNAEGVALAEAIVHGVDQVGSESDFAGLKKKNITVGYDIRDNCGDTDTTRKHAHAIAQEALNYKESKGKSGDKPADVVIAAFTNDDINSLTALDGEEIQAAASYSSENARLVKTEANQYKIGKLISVYPEEGKKIDAAAAIVKEIGFQYVYGIADDSVEGKNAMGGLKVALGAGTCMSPLYDSVESIVTKVKSNRRITVLIVHASKARELSLYKLFDNQNITDLTIITTQGWEDLSELQDVKEVVKGGLNIYYKRTSNSFENYMNEQAAPYTGREWIRSLFREMGGNSSCLTSTSASKLPICGAAKVKVRESLTKNAPDAEYAYHAVLSLAYAFQEKADGATLLDTIKGLKISIAALSRDHVIYDQKLAATISKFDIDNLRIIDGKLSKDSTTYIGWWDETYKKLKLKLSLTRSQIIWTDGKKNGPDPVSVCSNTCDKGSKRVFEKGQGQCCWECTKCPNGTASNLTNSDSCNSCPAGTVVKQPKQDGCKQYDLLYFEWFGLPGAILIVLMIIGVALVLLGLGVFSRNSQHDLVIYSNYNSLCLFLLAVLILIFAPVPLLVKIPTMSSCGAYILMFNVGVTIILGIITSRSAAINNLFDDNGELTKGTLGRFPRTTVVLLCVVFQIIIQIIAFNLEVIQTMHNETDQWDSRYHECSSWASSTFWAGFVINILISIVGNSLSCSSLNMADNAYELKYVLLCHLMFYLWGIVELVIFFRTNDENLAGGQAIVCVLLAISFFICYALPKIYAILFQSKAGKLIPQEEEEEEEEGDGVVMEAHAMHASAGFKGQGIVSIKIREEDEDGE